MKNLMSVAVLMAAVAALSACEKRTTVEVPVPAPAPSVVVPVPGPPGPPGATGSTGSTGAAGTSTVIIAPDPAAPASAAR
jgi:hypothetical protein